jgi:hypothetical protein
MATTIGQAVSRVRNIIKAVRTDAFLTDRFIYSLITKYADLYIKQELEKKRLGAFYSLFRTLPCVDLIEVDKVEACCDVESGCTIMRTSEKFPKVMLSIFGPLIRSVTSIDGSTDVHLTQPLTYQRMLKTSGAKYNKTKYYWFLNGYFYFPNLGWPQVAVNALWQGDISKFECASPCVSVQDSPTPIPDYLFALIEQNVLKELGMEIQIPQDPQVSDKQSQLRS